MTIRTLTLAALWLLALPALADTETGRIVDRITAGGTYSYEWTVTFTAGDSLTTCSGGELYGGFDFAGGTGTYGELMLGKMTNSAFNAEGANDPVRFTINYTVDPTSSRCTMGAVEIE